MNVPKISFLLTHFSNFRKQKAKLLSPDVCWLSHLILVNESQTLSQEPSELNLESVKLINERSASLVP